MEVYSEVRLTRYSLGLWAGVRLECESHDYTSEFSNCFASIIFYYLYRWGYHCYSIFYYFYALWLSVEQILTKNYEVIHKTTLHTKFSFIFLCTRLITNWLIVKTKRDSYFIIQKSCRLGQHRQTVGLSTPDVGTTQQILLFEMISLELSRTLISCIYLYN